MSYIDLAVAHAEREGRADYMTRRDDVNTGFQDEEWAWPLVDADEAYINAVGVEGICNNARIPVSVWDEISDAWLAAFRSAYEAAHLTFTKQ